MDDDRRFTKRRPDAPPGFFEVEAAGLAWLDEAARTGGGVPVVRPVEVRPDRLVLPRLSSVPADDAAAADLGRRLAATHAAGAPWFGCPPGGWTGDGFIGPLVLPHVHRAARARPEPDGSAADGGWGRFYAAHRLLPYARAARDRGALSAAGARAVERVCERLDGEEAAGPAEPPARLHGDLWSGNVLWTPSGVVLLDPAAHGGHRESDLAMLALFGLPRLATVLAAYDEAAPLADGWRDRVALHALHPLLVHAVLFGAGYGARAEAAARRYM
jgi:fructosamine-3-kinase